MIQLSFHSTLTVGQTEDRWTPHLPPIESTCWPYSTLKAAEQTVFLHHGQPLKHLQVFSRPPQALQQFPLPLLRGPVWDGSGLSLFWIRHLPFIMLSSGSSPKCSAVNLESSRTRRVKCLSSNPL